MRLTPFVSIALLLSLSACSSFSSVTVRNLSAFGNTSISKELVDGDRRVFIEADISDDILFNGTDTAIASFPDNSELEFTTAPGSGQKRRLLITSSRSGQVRYRFYEDGRIRDYDAKAQRWFAANIPLLLRETGFDYRGRIARLHEEGDHNRVIEEIALIRSDYVQTLYSTHLAAGHRLDSNEQVQLIALSTNISSNSQQAETLQGIYDSQEFSAKAWQAFIHASQNISSNSTLAGLYEELLFSPLPESVVVPLFRASKGIASDSQLSDLLAHGVTHQEMTKAAWQAWTDAAVTVESDSALSELIIEVLRTTPENFPHSDIAELAGHHVQSDSALSEVVEAAVNLSLADDDLVVWLQASKAIQSDSQLAEALDEVLAQRSMTNVSWGYWLGSASTIGSDSALAELLKSAVNSPGKRPPIADILGLAGNQIGSDSALARVLSASLERKLLTLDEHAAYTDALTKISSNSIKRELEQSLRD